MFKSLMAAGVLLLCSASAGALTANEERTALTGRLVLALVNEDFAAAEASYTPYLSPRVRTPDGAPTLVVLANGLEYLAKQTRNNDSAYRRQLEKAGRWRKAYPNSSAAWIFAAKVEMQQAWELRGSKLAKDVPEENWRRIRTHANNARELLLAAPAKVRNTPWWYTEMILANRLAAVDKFGELAELLDEGIRRYPDYTPLYQIAAVDLLPKWGGSYAQVDELVMRATRKSSDRQMLYAEIYSGLIYFDNQLFRNSLLRWEKLKPAFETLVQRYPTDWNKSRFAYAACLANDRVTTRALLMGLDARLDVTAWANNSPEAVSYCQNLAASAAPAGVPAANAQLQHEAAQTPLSETERAALDKAAQEDSKRMLEGVIKKAREGEHRM
ncbi:DUF4034 domain-containing protein [Chitinilyticum litopenaei]|uniref:DUF4034 domain-containing protein n=1 Tax=Chitinilyticum litopenaei TaxID=1121276 RepID=UPI00040558F6|nr:DUF4034 domain-containing protein [Chitinilyticum litopenaei]